MKALTGVSLGALGFERAAGWFGWRKGKTVWIGGLLGFMLFVFVISVFVAYQLGAPLPRQVHISLTNDSTEMSVQWLTWPRQVMGSYVEWGTSPRRMLNSAKGSSEIYTHEDYTSGSIHTVFLKSLRAGQRYYYRCGDPFFGWSEVHSFVAPPVDASIKELMVAVVGDIGTNSHSASTISNMISRSSFFDLILHAGDLSYANGKQPVWDIYGEMIEPLVSKIPYMAVVGNHENYDNFLPFTKRYNPPFAQERLYWSVNYGALHLIGLSSETLANVGSPQYKWLQEDLNSINRSLTPWVIAGWHRPWYCSNVKHNGDGFAMKAALETLFYRHQVDIVFAGHVHAYERTHPVYKEKVVEDGIVHITAGMGGTHEGLETNWFPTPSWSANKESAWGFGALKIVNRTHAYWEVYYNEGVDGDKAWIVRDADRRRKP